MAVFPEGDQDRMYVMEAHFAVIEEKIDNKIVYPDPFSASEWSADVPHGDGPSRGQLVAPQEAFRAPCWWVSHYGCSQQW